MLKKRTVFFAFLFIFVFFNVCILCVGGEPGVEAPVDPVGISTDSPGQEQPDDPSVENPDALSTVSPSGRPPEESPGLSPLVTAPDSGPVTSPIASDSGGFTPISDGVQIDVSAAQPKDLVKEILSIKDPKARADKYQQVLSDLTAGVRVGIDSSNVDQYEVAIKTLKDFLSRVNEALETYSGAKQARPKFRDRKTEMQKLQTDIGAHLDSAHKELDLYKKSLTSSIASETVEPGDTGQPETPGESPGEGPGEKPDDEGEEGGEESEGEESEGEEDGEFFVALEELPEESGEDDPGETPGKGDSSQIPGSVEPETPGEVVGDYVGTLEDAEVHASLDGAVDAAGGKVVDDALLMHDPETGEIVAPDGTLFRAARVVATGVAPVLDAVAGGLGHVADSLSTFRDWVSVDSQQTAADALIWGHHILERRMEEGGKYVASWGDFLQPIIRTKEFFKMEDASETGLWIKWFGRVEGDAATTGIGLDKFGRVLDSTTGKVVGTIVSVSTAVVTGVAEGAIRLVSFGSRVASDGLTSFFHIEPPEADVGEEVEHAATVAETDRAEGEAREMLSGSVDAEAEGVARKALRKVREAAGKVGDAVSTVAGKVGDAVSPYGDAAVLVLEGDTEDFAKEQSLNATKREGYVRTAEGVEEGLTGDAAMTAAKELQRASVDLKAQRETAEFEQKAFQDQVEAYDTEIAKMKEFIELHNRLKAKRESVEAFLRKRLGERPDASEHKLWGDIPESEKPDPKETSVYLTRLEALSKTSGLSDRLLERIKDLKSVIGKKGGQEGWVALEKALISNRSRLSEIDAKLKEPGADVTTLTKEKSALMRMEGIIKARQAEIYRGTSADIVKQAIRTDVLSWFDISESMATEYQSRLDATQKNRDALSAIATTHTATVESISTAISSVRGALGRIDPTVVAKAGMEVLVGPPPKPPKPSLLSRVWPPRAFWK